MDINKSDLVSNWGYNIETMMLITILEFQNGIYHPLHKYTWIHLTISYAITKWDHRPHRLGQSINKFYLKNGNFFVKSKWKKRKILIFCNPLNHLSFRFWYFVLCNVFFSFKKTKTTSKLSRENGRIVSHLWLRKTMRCAQQQ